MTEKAITQVGNIVSSNNDNVLKVWQVAIPAGRRFYQKHSHIQFEISLVKNGSGTYTSNGKNYEMKQGDCFVFCANEIHCITDVGEKGLTIINLHFEPQYLLGRSADSLSEKNIGLCFAHSENLCNRIPAEKSAVLTDIFIRICEELTDKKEEYQLAVKCYVNQILLLLIRNFGYTDESIAISKSHICGIKKAIDYIDSNLTEDISLNTAAQIAEMSPHYFSTLFHRSCNVRFQDYVNARRVEKAITYLQKDDCNLTMLEIAMTCGFNNTANFNKAFKKQTGLTPSEFKKNKDMLI